MLKRTILFLWIGFIYGCGAEGNPVGHFEELKKEIISSKKENKSISTPSKKEMIKTPKKPANIHADLLSIIRQSSNQLSGTKYSIAKKADCSGMFHQLLNTFKDTYPNYKFPNINNARSSRDIALWYAKNGNFTIIRDVGKSSHLIQPGMVMFYGYGNPKVKYDRKKLNMQTLITRNIGINHVAVVTDVHFKNGVLESYDIFHGRNPKHPAGITTSRRVYLNRPDVPAYGNGMEPWVAVAELLVLKK